MNRLNLADMLDFYAAIHGSDNWDAMLQDYRLNQNLNRDDLNKIILKDLGNACPYVTDTTTFKMALETFFIKYEDNINRLTATLNIIYNPIHNKDYTHKTDDEFTHENHKGNEQIVDEDTTDTIDNTTTLNVSAYNDEEGFEPKNESVSNNVDVLDKYEKTTNRENTNGTNIDDKTERIYGTDGAFQDLIEKERKTAQFNIYTWIISRMRKELFLLVY